MLAVNFITDWPRLAFWTSQKPCVFTIQNIFRSRADVFQNRSHNSHNKIAGRGVNSTLFCENVNTLRYQRKGLLYETDPSRRSPCLRSHFFLSVVFRASPPRYSYANTGLSVSLVTLSMVFKLLRDFANDGIKFGGPVAIWAPLTRLSVCQQPYKNSIHAVWKIITHHTRPYDSQHTDV